MTSGSLANAAETVPASDNGMDELRTTIRDVKLSGEDDALSDGGPSDDPAEGGMNGEGAHLDGVKKKKKKKKPKKKKVCRMNRLRRNGVSALVNCSPR